MMIGTGLFFFWESEIFPNAAMVVLFFAQAKLEVFVFCDVSRAVVGTIIDDGMKIMWVMIANISVFSSMVGTINSTCTFVRVGVMFAPMPGARRVPANCIVIV